LFPRRRTRTKKKTVSKVGAYFLKKPINKIWSGDGKNNIKKKNARENKRG
jgi:hypothetical protein